jgi:plasmid stability protein
MATITIRNLDEHVKQRLRIRAAEHGRSMEEEARMALTRFYGGRTGQQGLGTFINEMFKPFGGIELELPSRNDRPRIPDFSDPDYGE